ncbi:MAG: hypothetical protein RLY49_231 [Candidatus Parcubacteria bacterium]|jgi:A/G-specific adenine glycosylase
MTKRQIEKFQKEILTHYKENKRSMPWRDISNPYKIFVSEMMLQQTQVERVRLKYAEFIKKFPTLKSVAQANKIEILKVWQGLGYNRRALFIKKACEEIISKHKGIFPKDFDTLQTLPGIGPSTAGALCAFAYNQPVFFIETNIRAVILHFFFKNKTNVSDKEIVNVLKKVTPTTTDSRDWYYALYDYGTFLKKTLGKKKVELHKKSKHYVKQSKFEGSFRQKRARVLKLKLADSNISDEEIIQELSLSPQEFEDVIESLDKDGLI